MRLAYFTVIADNNMVKQKVKKWWERITFKFWLKTKTVPRTDFIVLNKELKIICHPTMVKLIEKNIERLI